MRNSTKMALSLICLCSMQRLSTIHADSAPSPAASRSVVLASDGTVSCSPFSDRGDRIPDFSRCGYGGGGVAIPDVPRKRILQATADLQDATQRIQTAIDEVSSLPPDANDFRGAVLLQRGVYNVAGTLQIGADGVVLRGEGNGKEGTILFASGTTKRTLIAVTGPDVKVDAPAPEIVAIADPYVPVGARTVRVAKAGVFGPGDEVMVKRLVNDAWIRHIGMDKLRDLASDNRKAGTKNWTPRGFCIAYRRTVTAVQGAELTLDTPLVCAIDSRWGGGQVYRRRDCHIEHVGVENLRIVSAFDEGKTATSGKIRYYSDEQHCGGGIKIERARNVWVRDVVSVHTDRCVTVGRQALWVTVQDCASLDPVAVITGGRRYPFGVDGQQCLFQRCYTESARHGFAYGSRIPGPNVVLDCMTVTNYGASEPHHRWSTGGLFDNFSGNLLIGNRGAMGSGHGWAGAGFVAWNTEGTAAVQSPPGSPNVAIGHVGKRDSGPYKDVSPQGEWESHGRHVIPRSLYLAQLQTRLGEQAVTNVTTTDQRETAIYDALEKRYGTGRTWTADCSPDWANDYPGPWNGLLGTDGPAGGE